MSRIPLNHAGSERVTLYHGDCLDVLRELDDCSIDAVVTDPPYGLGFMGKEWDSIKAAHRPPSAADLASPLARMTTGKGPAAVAFDGIAFQQWCQLWTAECLRVLKPGGHLLAFGGTRTWHRLAVAVEDAGFEIRDSIAWMYGSGFPKSLDVSKAIDKAAGAERTEGAREWSGGQRRAGVMGDNLGTQTLTKYDTPATPEAERWQGWGTALKPAFEPIVVARKPLSGTVAANVLAHGTGALNVDGCRIGDGSDSQGERPTHESSATSRYADHGAVNFAATPGTRGGSPSGRWPANVALDEDAAAELDEQSGELSSVKPFARSTDADSGIYGSGATSASAGSTVAAFGDSGGASRFFYTAKANSSERVKADGIAHPTVKPLSLMRWLVRLVTPPDGIVLEPFAGSGTTVEAALLEGFRCVAIEREGDYLPLILQRINRRRDPVSAVKASGEDAGLFDLLPKRGA